MNYPVGLPLEQARDLILEHCAALKNERVMLEEAEGRILAEDIVAQENMPPFPRSPYDGYALRAVDTLDADKEHPIILAIIEEVPAGYAPTKAVNAGQATKILTGAPIPTGADAVIKFEDTEFTTKTVTISKRYHSGENIVPAGEDIQIGAVVASKGTVLDAAFLGILAGLGHAEVEVICRPKMEMISVGDELLPITEALTPGKIRNSSVYTLSSFARRCGADVHCCGIVQDKTQLIADAVADAASKADMIITTGGVSVGDYDKMLSALQMLGAEILFWKVQMKPGSPFVAAMYQGTLILCLSGNPSAAVVAYFLQTEKQGNGMLHPLHKCTILGELPAGSPPMEAGRLIDAYLLFE